MYNTILEPVGVLFVVVLNLRCDLWIVFMLQLYELTQYQDLTSKIKKLAI